MTTWRAAALALLASGCAVKTTYSTLGADDLPPLAPVPQLRCAYFLGDITDARPEGDHAGQLGHHIFNLEEPVSLLSAALQPASWSIGDQEAALRVDVRLLRLYMTQQHSAKIPVVVLEARPQRQKPFIVRSQASSMNWNGSEKEAHSALAMALGQVRGHLVDGLNARCPAVSTLPRR